ncbi:MULTISPECIES: hypothetical protein [unclassified Streptomyces]|uniref:hypothetical protein n=1 Tax=unclassified Streptomyces TaxID=2593676 RepID=UPI0033AD9E97
MRTALRTAIATALVAGVAITAPAFAAGAAFAADGPAAAPAPAVTSAAPAPVVTSEAPAPATTTAVPKPTATTSTPAGAAKGTLVRTETLRSGTVAKIYEVAPFHHRAELFARGASVGVVDANTRWAVGQNNGEFFVLSAEGRSYNWQGNHVPAAAPGLYRLADGTVVELGRKDGRYGLQLVENGKGRGFTYLNGFRQVWLYGGKALVVLEQDGGLAAYLPGSSKQAAPRYVGTGAPVPKPGPAALPPAKVLDGPTVLGPCTITQEIRSSRGDDWLLVMTNDAVKGPWAVLKNPKPEFVSRVDRAHPLDTVDGLKIEGADTRTPRLGQRSQGGDTPYRYNDFPVLPRSCYASATPAGQTGTGAVQQGGQTSVVPKGGVAAGAEGVVADDSTALVAAGAGAASLAAAGLGFVVLRRRAAARV